MKMNLSQLFDLFITYLQSSTICLLISPLYEIEIHSFLALSKWQYIYIHIGIQ